MTDTRVAHITVICHHHHLSADFGLGSSRTSSHKAASKTRCCGVLMASIKSSVAIGVWLLCWGIGCHAFSFHQSKPPIAAELEVDQVDRVHGLISNALGDSCDTVIGEKDSLAKADRYSSARMMVSELTTNDGIEQKSDHQLVYGELSVPVLAKILDAVEVQGGEKFLDIGSGDGALVLGAALLFPDHIEASRGVELVPGLLDRSKLHLLRLQDIVRKECPESVTALQRVDFSLGNVYDVETSPEMAKLLSDTSLAVCFATTWCLTNPLEEDDKTNLDRRRLPQLSKALRHIPGGGRIVIVDGRLDESDGYRWDGDLKISCPDTAPYSIASLYSRL